MYFRPGAICNTVGFSRYFSFGLEVNASQVGSFQGTAESKHNSMVSRFPRFHVDAKDLEHKDLKEAKGRAHTSKIRLHFFISSFRFFFFGNASKPVVVPRREKRRFAHMATRTRSAFEPRKIHQVHGSDLTEIPEIP